MPAVAWPDASKVQPGGEPRPGEAEPQAAPAGEPAPAAAAGKLCPPDPDSFALCIELERHRKSRWPARFE